MWSPVVWHTNGLAVVVVVAVNKDTAGSYCVGIPIVTASPVYSHYYCIDVNVGLIATSTTYFVRTSHGCPRMTLVVNFDNASVVVIRVIIARVEVTITEGALEFERSIYVVNFCVVIAGHGSSHGEPECAVAVPARDPLINRSCRCEVECFIAWFLLVRKSTATIRITAGVLILFSCRT